MVCLSLQAKELTRHHKYCTCAFGGRFDRPAVPSLRTCISGARCESDGAAARPRIFTAPSPPVVIPQRAGLSGPVVRPIAADLGVQYSSSRHSLRSRVATRRRTLRRLRDDNEWSSSPRLDPRPLKDVRLSADTMAVHRSNERGGAEWRRPVRLYRRTHPLMARVPGSFRTSR